MRAYVLASPYFDRHATYVALSRHRASVDVFWSREVFKNEQALATSLSRERAKDWSLDYGQMPLEPLQMTATALQENFTSLGLEALLQQYIALELEQTRCVHALYASYSQDSAARQVARTAALASQQTIKDFVQAMKSHPEVVQGLTELKEKILPPHLSQRGGFAAIQARLQAGEWLLEDQQAVLAQFRGRVYDQVRMRSESRDMGGRTQ